VTSLASLSEEFVELAFRHDPVFATEMGIHDYDHLLPDDSPAGFESRAAWRRDFARRLEAVSSQDLSTAQRVDRALLRSHLAGFECDAERVRSQAMNPVRYPETALHSLLPLLSRAYAPPDERKEAIVARLMAIPDYLAATRQTLEQVPRELLGIAAEVNMTGPGFVDEVVRSLVRAFPGEAERIEHAGARARMGFIKYQEFLERDLEQRVGGSFAIGREAMDEKLEKEHLLEMDSAALEVMGLAEIERIRGELEREAERLDPRRPWREQIAVAKLKHPEHTHLLEAYAVEIGRARRFVLETGLVPLLDGKLDVVETPVFERAVIPQAHYAAPGPFDVEQTAALWVTPVDLSLKRVEREQQLQGHSASDLPVVTVHETYPGRHLQLLHAHRAEGRLRRIARSDLFAKGWAVYCEQLMDERGYFTEPVTRLFRLKALLWRACRVVLDVRLHTGRATLDEAAQFLVEHAMLERVIADREVKRSALTPTQPMCYLVGMKLLLELRAEARERLGDRFRIEEFHAALLAGGTIPPALARDELWDRMGTAV
jgi:uncharacterized protein (DUF885 family)